MRVRELLIGALVLASRATAWEHLTEEEAHDNDEEQPGYQLVAFIHPEDETSQALEPEWLKVQKTTPPPTTPSLKQGKILSIDCTISKFMKDLCQDEGIKSFPTIRLYRDDIQGDYERYRGPPKASAILGFLHRSLRPAISVVNDKNSTDFINGDDIVFVGRFGGGDKSQVEGRFREAALRYRDRFSFGLDVATARAGKDKVQSLVTCWNSLDDMKHETTQLETRETLEAFIKLCSTPLIPEMTIRNELSFYETRKSIVHYFTRNEDEREEYVKEMRPLAKKYQEYLHFTTTDVKDFPDAPERMGLRWGSSRGLSVQNPNNGDVYPYTRSQPLSARSVELFLGDIILGKVKPLGSGGDNTSGGGDGRREHGEL